MSAALQRIGRVSLAAALAAALHGAALYCASQVSENIRYNRDPTSYQVWTILALGVGALFLIGVVTQSYSAWREDRHIAGLASSCSSFSPGLASHMLLLSEETSGLAPNGALSQAPLLGSSAWEAAGIDINER